MTCSACRASFPCQDGIADFSGGIYYDHFPGPEVLSEENRRGLKNEHDSARIEDFYLPLLDRMAADRGVPREQLRVLDSGCGNGESIDTLNRAGVDAWGHDLSQLRKWQWRERERPERLIVADGATLPFPDAYFDAVIASGVLEHVGVQETGGKGYEVHPLPDRDERRRRYLAELVRILAPRGRLLLDFPNGSFLVDFWHGPRAGGVRFHSTSEGFLPTLSEVRALCRRVDGNLIASALSPERRLRFRQVSAHWYGRALRAPVAVFFRLMSARGFRFLAGTPLNPYLVISIDRRSDSAR